MDYFKNGDFSNFIKGKVLKEIFAKKYMSQLKNGLKYLYENRGYIPPNCDRNVSYYKECNNKCKLTIGGECIWYRLY